VTVAQEPVSYLDTPTTVVLVVGLLVAGVCVVAGLRGRPPGALTLGATAVLEVALIAVLATYAVRTADGQSPVGPAWELWAYLVTVVMLPALAVVWAREEPTRWSTFVLALAGFVAAVMTARAAQVWYGVGFG
jgi:hypothetical protein